MFLRRLSPALLLSLFAWPVAAQPRPDLIISAVTVSPPSVAENSGFDVRVEVQNVGQLPAAFVNFTVSFPSTVLVNHVDPDRGMLRGCTNTESYGMRTITCHGYEPVNGVDTTPLPPMAITSVGLSLTAPALTAPATVVKIPFVAKADPETKITEGNESNNGPRYNHLIVFIAPQLRVDMNVQPSARIGQGFGFPVTVTNIGKVDATLTSVKIVISSLQDFKVEQITGVSCGSPEVTRIWDNKCDFGTIPASSKKSIFFTITPISKYPETAQITVNATVSAFHEDTPNDNKVEKTIAVTP